MRIFATSLLKVLHGALLLVLLFAFTIPISSNAQVRDYRYEHIEYVFNVNTDSTVDVTESQEYYFIGEYHVGYRDIPLKKIGSISEIQVIDARTGTPLTYSPERLEGNNPTHWGKYTYWQQNSRLNIEWYFERNNIVPEKREWLLKYKLHGAVSFLKEHDELYWNLVESYEKPIGVLTAKIILPQGTKSEGMFGTLYSSKREGVSAVPSITNNEFLFTQLGVLPNEKVTVAAGWPKGIITYNAYLNDLFRSYLDWIIGAFILFASIGYAYYYQVWAPVRYGRGTIVTEYSPPDELRPAEVGVLVSEQVGRKMVPATIVDLAIRKYLVIEEDAGVTPQRLVDRMDKYVGLAITVMQISLIVIGIMISWSKFSPASIIIALLTTLILYFYIKNNGQFIVTKKEYLLRKLPRENAGDNLRPFESKLLNALFSSSDTFSTREVRKNANRSQLLMLVNEVSQLDKLLYEALSTHGHAFDGSFRLKRNALILVCLLLWVVAGFWGGKIESSLSFFGGYAGLVIASIFSTAIILYARFSPRPSHEGQLKKEAWLGFKQYLVTAERDRVQDLTPERFEKYLPYAMIFDVEKKWSNAFRDVTMPQPQWYSSSALYGVTNSSSSASTFSPAAFTAGFSASFTSSMASSGGGGAGGGGHAGGGGGGGGGGAR